MSSAENRNIHEAVNDPKVLWELLKDGANPNQFDDDGLTPLHRAIISSNFNATLNLLIYNANPNVRVQFGELESCTPLHIASMQLSYRCLQALIVFGANVDETDNRGNSARHVLASACPVRPSDKDYALFVLAAAGATRCDASKDCPQGCKHDGQDNGKKPLHYRVSKDGTTVVDDTCKTLEEIMLLLGSFRKDATKAEETEHEEIEHGGRILCIDGGGVRGLVVTQILLCIEREFNKIQNVTETKIISYFDWISGTSTGGILALALACGKTVLQTQQLYLKLNKTVFSGNRPYDPHNLDEILMAELGTDTLSSINGTRVMVMVSGATEIPLQLKIFRNFPSPREELGLCDDHSCNQSNDMPLWEIARCAAAAPTFFHLRNENFMDGALIANNPTLASINELVYYKAARSKAHPNQSRPIKIPSVILSVGTGQQPRKKSSAEDFNVRLPNGVCDAIVDVVPKCLYLMKVVADQCTNAEGTVVDVARSWASTLGASYQRFDPELGSSIELDETNNAELISIMWETSCYMAGRKQEIAKLFQKLVINSPNP